MEAGVVPVSVGRHHKGPEVFQNPVDGLALFRSRIREFRADVTGLHTWKNRQIPQAIQVVADPLDYLVPGSPEFTSRHVDHFC